MRLTDAPRLLADAGLPVVVLPGYATRGVDLARTDAIVEHCTVTPGGRDPAVVARLLRDGHSTLRGPLAQFGHDDHGVWWCIAAGRCNHNGYGLFGNQAIGVEKMHPNTSAWPYLGVDSWVRGSAVLAAYYRIPPVNVLGHRETDPRRKTDPAGLDLNAFRRAVVRIATLKDDDMTPDEAERLARVEQKLDRIIDGVPAFGVPPLHETQLMISGILRSGPIDYMRHTADRETRRNVRTVGERLGLIVRKTPGPPDTHTGELYDRPDNPPG